MRRLRSGVVAAVAGFVMLTLGACVAARPPAPGSASPSGSRSGPPSGRPATQLPATGAAPAWSKTLSPQDAVGQAAAKLFTASFRFTLGNEARRADGEYQAATGAARLTRVIDGRKAVVEVFGSELLLSGFAQGGTVLRVDASRLPPGHDLLPVVAPDLVRYLLTGARKVEYRGGGEYSGRVDLSRVDLSGVGLTNLAATQRLIGYLAKQAGDRAGELGFTATVGAGGTLTGFRIRFPKADRGADLEYEFVVVRIDPTVSVSRPAGEAVPAPLSLYQP